MFPCSAPVPWLATPYAITVRLDFDTTMRDGDPLPRRGKLYGTVTEYPGVEGNSGLQLMCGVNPDARLKEAPEPAT
jgi:hypothetical protein